ncbi:MAG: DUF975 family protein [Lachnospiraceae bacterium]|nr:DUF975 family protein [Lachnospiraceae bacterium]
MWNRAEIKTKGKESMKRNYWKSVVAALIYLLFFASTGVSSKSGADEFDMEKFLQDPDAALILGIVAAAMGVGLLISFVLKLFVFNPLEAGCNRFFLTNQDSDANLGELGHNFKNNYMSTAIGLFLRDLLVCIGCFLFVVPGIILHYSYRLVPYILSEDASISATEALKRSRAMMKGHKWNVFVFDLSFIGWAILSAITCGIVGVFYVNPYYHNADAALYQAIRNSAN